MNRGTHRWSISISSLNFVENEYNHSQKTLIIDVWSTIKWNQPFSTISWCLHFGDFFIVRLSSDRLTLCHSLSRPIYSLIAVGSRYQNGFFFSKIWKRDHGMQQSWHTAKVFFSSSFHFNFFCCISHDKAIQKTYCCASAQHVGNLLHFSFR